MEGIQGGEKETVVVVWISVDTHPLSLYNSTYKGWVRGETGANGTHPRLSSPLSVLCHTTTTAKHLEVLSWRSRISSLATSS